MFQGISCSDRFWGCFELLILYLLNQDFSLFQCCFLIFLGFFSWISVSPGAMVVLLKKSSEASHWCIWYSFSSASQSHSLLQLLHRVWFSHLSRRNSSSGSCRELKCHMSSRVCPGSFAYLALWTCWVCLSKT